MKTKSPLKRFAMAAAAVTLVAGPLGATAAYADPPGRHYNNNDRGRDWNGRSDYRRDNGRHHGWQRGQRLGNHERRHYQRVDYRRAHLRAPPRGYHYVRDDRGDTLLVGIATGVILGVILNSQ